MEFFLGEGVKIGPSSTYFLKFFFEPFLKLAESPVKIFPGHYVGPSTCNDFTSALGAGQKVSNFVRLVYQPINPHHCYSSNDMIMIGF